MALLAEYVIETDGASVEIGILDAELGAAFLDEAGHAAGLADAAEVALHVGHEAGDTGFAERLCQHLEGDGLSGTGGSGDESVAVGHFTEDGDGTLRAVGDIEPFFVVVHIVWFYRYSNGLYI